MKAQINITITDKYSEEEMAEDGTTIEELRDLYTEGFKTLLEADIDQTDVQMDLRVTITDNTKED